MKLSYLTKAAVVVALLSTLSGCWIFMPPGVAAGMVADMVRAVALAQEAVRAKEPKPEASHAQWLASFFAVRNPRQRKARVGSAG